MTKCKIIAGNWKMNLGIKDSLQLLAEIKQGITGDLKDVAIWVTPSTIAVSEVAKASVNTPIVVGAQNVHWAEKGAFTGESSVCMLKEAGIKYVLVGHSERRHVFHESIEEVNQRALTALQSGLITVLCVGETLQERENNQTEKVLHQQLFALLNKLPNEHSKNLVVAYEPVWAIGTGKVANLEEINSAHTYIRNCYNELVIKTDHILPILYGGSVTPDNFAEIINLDTVHGGLVGGASLKANQFLELIRIATNTN